MLSPTLGLLRGLRAVSLGVVGFILALTAHAAAGGSVPGPAVLFLVAGLIGLAAVLLTGARLSPVRVGISLGVMQVVLHEVFGWLGSPSNCLTAAMSAPAGGPRGHSRPILDCASGMASSGMGHTSILGAMPMVVAHVVATAVMAGLLAYGEKALWFLADWVRPPRWLPVRPPELPARRVESARAPRMLRVRFARGGVGRRGPPSQCLHAIV